MKTTKGGIPECDCCMWDDEGYVHEPNCSFRIWKEEQEKENTKMTTKGEKKCIKCKIIKPIEQFTVVARIWRQSYCNQCRVKLNQACKGYKNTLKVAANKNLSKKFGFNDTQALERDSYCCRNCGMTNDEHKIRYGKRLNIHHIDGSGTSSNKNNILDNLETLCVSCHAKLHKLGKLERSYHL